MSLSGPHRYLSVVSWPDGWTRDDVAVHLAPILGVDTPSVRTRLGPPPRIYALLPPEDAMHAAFAVQEAGGDAFTFSIDDLQQLGPTLKVRDLGIESGRLELELWRGEPVSIDPQSIDVAVRAHVSETLGRKNVPPPPELIHLAGIGAASLVHGWSFGGGYGCAGRLHARAEYADLASMDRRVNVSHKLDLHTTDGRVYQIDGDKFGFRILGGLRGGSDNVNIDHMCALVVHLSPDVVVDPYFELWTPPPAHDRLRLPMMQINKDDPAFAFYSRWAALMYRHVMGRD